MQKNTVLLAKISENSGFSGKKVVKICENCQFFTKIGQRFSKSDIFEQISYRLLSFDPKIWELFRQKSEICIGFHSKKLAEM